MLGAGWLLSGEVVALLWVACNCVHTELEFEFCFEFWFEFGFWL